MTCPQLLLLRCCQCPPGPEAPTPPQYGPSSECEYPTPGRHSSAARRNAPGRPLDHAAEECLPDSGYSRPPPATVVFSAAGKRGRGGGGPEAQIEVCHGCRITDRHRRRHVRRRRPVRGAARGCVIATPGGGADLRRTGALAEAQGA